MHIPSELYRPSLALATDLYQLTMAYGYWKTGTAERDTVFQAQFRANPFGGGFSVACGLETLLDWVEHFQFTGDDLSFLSELRGADGRPLFEEGFLRFLSDLRLKVDLDAVPEGTMVFPHEPLVRVQGPVLHCQLLETQLLNTLNFQTLIATKAARLKIAARGAPVLEFGLRRAQGLDGAISASRAAYVGGVDATSNVLAARVLGIPVRGTHAHSWVMLFGDELEAFEAYAGALPNNCVFLVDTYDTLRGVDHAIEVGRTLRARGHDLLGVRLDSGDLAYLSKEARRRLDAAGFPAARIYASNDLDEAVIQSLFEQGATIDVFGVGTRLVTGYDQPALGGVYKLTAVRGPSGAFEHRIKLSDHVTKISDPGVLQVRRFYDGETLLADAIWDQLLGCPEEVTVVDPVDATRRWVLARGTAHEDLLVPVLRAGKPVYVPPPLAELRERTARQLQSLPPGLKRFVNPHEYPVGLERTLHELKTELVLEAKGVPA
jgi:nicotinate phosphoribosyltransferase